MGRLPGQKCGCVKYQSHKGNDSYSQLPNRIIAKPYGYLSTGIST